MDQTRSPWRAELVGQRLGAALLVIWETWPREGQRLGQGHTVHGGLEEKAHTASWPQCRLVRIEEKREKGTDR